MEMFNGVAGPKASGTSYQHMFAAAPPVAASSSCSAISPHISAGFTSGGFSDSQSFGNLMSTLDVGRCWRRAI